MSLDNNFSQILTSKLTYWMQYNFNCVSILFLNFIILQITLHYKITMMNYLKLSAFSTI